MHGPHQPGWAYYRQYLDFVARGNFILQIGTLRRDVAFWQKKTIYHGHTEDRTYVPDDLELSGKTVTQYKLRMALILGRLHIRVS